jgi:hypothetical protein
MTKQHAPGPTSAAVIPFAVAAELQDHLMAACTDLGRLQALLADACAMLMASFRGAEEQVIAMQLEDLTSQLIQHTQGRLRGCVDRLACELFEPDADDPIADAALLRPNPVTQSEMGTGSIELF